MGWSFARASVRGTSHQRAGTRLQDAAQCRIVSGPEGDERFYAIVADGAGSAEYGGEGAALVCRIIGQLCSRYLSSDAQLPSDDDIWTWVDEARDRIHIAASKREVQRRQFASTLVMVMASSSEILTAHVGDGAIVARSAAKDWCLLSAPQNGEYASTTFFVTDDPAPALRITRQSNAFDALAIFSDGIENLVLESATHAPSPAFFIPMVRPLDESSESGDLRSLSRGLSAFLDSERVNDRTDDDKTLVMAVCK